MLVVQRYYPPWLLGGVAAAGCLAGLVPASVQLLAAASILSKNVLADQFGVATDARAQTWATRGFVLLVAGAAFVFWLYAQTSLVGLLLIAYNGITQLFPGVALSFLPRRPAALERRHGHPDRACSCWQARPGVRGLRRGRPEHRPGRPRGQRRDGGALRTGAADIPGLSAPGRDPKRPLDLPRLHHPALLHRHDPPRPGHRLVNGPHLRQPRSEIDGQLPRTHRRARAQLTQFCEDPVFERVGLHLTLTMKLLSWNVNGVRAALRYGLLDYLKREQADVVCLQETRAPVESLAPLMAAGYHVLHQPGATRGLRGHRHP